ncbi:MAG: ParB/RepB/Spo0J family partition protein [Ruminiclostridium sp.]|nr:ParB/RepB/Spo0J family partition protein [Ruminiclostridium sp.]
MAIFQKNQQDNRQETAVNKVVELPISSIVPNPAQPRVIFDDYELSRLAVSIQQNGILQPLTVRRTENSLTYELIAGERRLRACKLLNMTYVPCIIITASVKDSAVLAVLENLQRADLSFMEEAYAIKNLIDYYGFTQEEAAARLGTAQSTIANKLRLLKLTDDEKALVVKYKLTERQARALLRLESEKRPDAIHYIGINQLNTAQTDAYIDDLLKGKPHKPTVRKRWTFRAVNLYINTFNKTIDAMKEAGINCETSKNRTEDFVEYVVKIPLKQVE